MCHSHYPHAHETDTTARGNQGYRRKLFAMGLLALLVACSGDSPTAAAPTPSAVRLAVTGAAAAAIGPDGRLRLSQAPADVSERELTVDEALTFADSYLRYFAPMTRSWLEATHGAPLDLRSLKSCGRPLYARSAFEPPPQSIPSVYRRVHGPWWLLTYCDANGSPSVSVAISAWATDLTMVDGKLQFPKISGTEFVVVGIPVGHVGEYPSSPEAAILIAARETGTRISEVPELITPLPTEGPPQLARWRITLEGNALVKTSSGQRATRELFIGPSSVGGRQIVESIASLNQPSTFDLRWSPLPTIGEPYKDYIARSRTPQLGKVPRRADTPVSVEPIDARED